MKNADWWIKYFWIRFRDSVRVQQMKDYQRYWYHALICESIYAERPGFIANDQDMLYRLSGCTAGRQFFVRNCAVVVSAFSVTDDGKWLFHPRAKQVAEQLAIGSGRRQADEDSKSVSSLSLSLISFDLLDKATEELFVFYSELFERDGRYKLTEARRKKCIVRLHEHMKANGLDVASAVEAAKEAMRNLKASEFHWTNGYYDWTDHLFKSRECFEKRLTVRPISGKAPSKSEQRQQQNRETILNAFGVNDSPNAGYGVPDVRKGIDGE